MTDKNSNKESCLSDGCTDDRLSVRMTEDCNLNTESNATGSDAVTDTDVSDMTDSSVIRHSYTSNDMSVPSNPDTGLPLNNINNLSNLNDSVRCDDNKSVDNLSVTESTGFKEISTTAKDPLNTHQVTNNFDVTCNSAEESNSMKSDLSEASLVVKASSSILADKVTSEIQKDGNSSSDVLGFKSLPVQKVTKPLSNTLYASAVVNVTPASGKHQMPRMLSPHKSESSCLGEVVRKDDRSVSSVVELSVQPVKQDHRSLLIVRQNPASGTIGDKNLNKNGSMIDIRATSSVNKSTSSTTKPPMYSLLRYSSPVVSSESPSNQSNSSTLKPTAILKVASNKCITTNARTVPALIAPKLLTTANPRLPMTGSLSFVKIKNISPVMKLSKQSVNKQGSVELIRQVSAPVVSRNSSDMSKSTAQTSGITESKVAYQSGVVYGIPQSLLKCNSEIHPQHLAESTSKDSILKTSNSAHLKVHSGLQKSNIVIKSRPTVTAIQLSALQQIDNNKKTKTVTDPINLTSLHLPNKHLSTGNEIQSVQIESQQSPGVEREGEKVSPHSLESADRKLKRKSGDVGNVEGVVKLVCVSAENEDVLSHVFINKNDSRKGSAVKKRGFSWTQYLTETNATVAPQHCFYHGLPSMKMGFQVGMKCEGIDPKHPNLYCVLSVMEVKGFRMRLHFDQYSESYDFWVNADCPFIFPPGWAEEQGKPLQPPKEMVEQKFSWTQYLESTGNSGWASAPRHLFHNIMSSDCLSNVSIGMKLEAVDKKSTSLTCVATVADILGDKILVHFDGWDSIYDYWADMTSPYIHPVGWCQENAKPISPPNDWEDISSFTWDEYLRTTGSQPVPREAFKSREKTRFRVGQKLEAVDRRNPLFVRVASVVAVDDYRVRIGFDGWAECYEYWEDDDSPDLHPAGWSYKTDHVLTPPPGLYDVVAAPVQGCCPTPGCTGVGHLKGALYSGHHSAFGCPYSSVNLNKEYVLPDRLLNVKIIELSSTQMKNFSAQSYSNLSPSDAFKGKVNASSASGSDSKSVQYSTVADTCVTSAVSSGGDERLHTGMTGNESSRGIFYNRLSLHRNINPHGGPGSGRGRKKKKILKLMQKQRLLDSSDGHSRLLHGIHHSVYTSPTTSRSLVSVRDPDKPGSSRSLYLERLLPGVRREDEGEVSDWSVERVASFISRITHSNHCSNLISQQEVDGECLMLLTQADIVDILKIKLGPAVKIYNSILLLKHYQLNRLDTC